jgi:hypothetical protein
LKEPLWGGRRDAVREELGHTAVGKAEAALSAAASGWSSVAAPRARQ